MATFKNSEKCGSVTYLYFTGGFRAVLDSVDWDRVKIRRWRVNKAGGGLAYVAGTRRLPNGEPRTEFLHTVLTGWPRVDHHDGNGLNNCRKNLRPCSGSTNAQNQKPQSRSGKHSRFKGVTKNPLKPSCWVARIRVHGKLIYLGSFQGEIEAAKAYNLAAKKHFNDFARLNEF
jgi:hypothetical protein